MEEREIKLYLAGPDVFRPDALAYAELQRNICKKYGFIPLHPMDNNINLEGLRRRISRGIFRGDASQIRECHIAVANCNYFRGGCMDDGTAFEIGMTYGLGKMTYGYMDSLKAAKIQIARKYPCKTRKGKIFDKDGCLVDDFGDPLNLMIPGAIEDSGGRLIEGDFEAAIEQLRIDIDRWTVTLDQ